MQDLTATLYIRQIWHDYRLAYGNNSENKDIILPDPYSGPVWKPDSFFKNGKSERVQTGTEPNIMFRVFNNGTIFYTQRYLFTCISFFIYENRHITCDTLLKRIKINLVKNISYVQGASTFSNKLQ